ncbi:MAG: stage II sporulation protein P [Clostridiales bacterium]|nr:stage II sporulation protein P [Clostridiales bacterium]
MINDRIKKSINFLLTFDKDDLSSIILSELPLISIVNESSITKSLKDVSNKKLDEKIIQIEDQSLSQTETKEEINENLKPIKIFDLSQKRFLKNKDSFQVYIENETQKKIDINELLNSNMFLDLKNEGPKILILHTCSTEAFQENECDFYDKSKNDYENDDDKNVIKIGQEMERKLNENGVKTLHDKTHHDQNENFENRYLSSLKTIEKYKEKFPTIQIVFDIHRDCLIYKDDINIKLITEINGEKCSQCMFVVGTDEGGLNHSNWKNNLIFASKLQRIIEEKYPGLMRPISLKKERLNGHASDLCLIVEIGTSANTLNESVKSGLYICECILKFLKDL